MDEGEVSALILFGTAFGLLLLVVVVSTNVLSDAIGSFYARWALASGFMILASLAGSLIAFILQRRLIAWRCFWLAGSLLAGFLLWFYSPSVLLDRVSRASDEFREPIELPAGLPGTPKHREEVLYSEMLVDLHQRRADYESALQEINPKRERIPIDRAWCGIVGGASTLLLLLPGRLIRHYFG
jgi:hypothetical protein